MRRFLSLFSGIGGLDLGLERAGWECAGQIEIDPYCQQVLATRWPDVRRHDDVSTISRWWDGESVELIAGGFPCQPFSPAGHGLGMDDSRWGWPAMRDAIMLVRPSYVIVENVPGLLANTGAFGQILSNLSALGYDAEWSCISACSVGAPHVRERLFLVAYPHSFHGEIGMAYPGRWWGETHERVDDIETTAAHQEKWMLETHGESRGVDDGISDRLEPVRVKALGNAVVPQVAMVVGRLVMAHADLNLAHEASDATLLPGKTS